MDKETYNSSIALFVDQYLDCMEEFCQEEDGMSLDDVLSIQGNLTVAQFKDALLTMFSYDVIIGNDSTVGSYAVSGNKIIFEIDGTEVELEYENSSLRITDFGDADAAVEEFACSLRFTKA